MTIEQFEAENTATPTGICGQWEEPMKCAACPKLDKCMAGMEYLAEYESNLF